MSLPARHHTVESTVAYYDIGEVKHEFDGSGNHCLSFKDKVGVWAGYGDIAKLTVNGVTFGATTEYYWPDMPEIFVIHSLLEHRVDVHAEPTPPQPKKITVKRVDTCGGTS